MATPLGAPVTPAPAAGPGLPWGRIIGGVALAALLIFLLLAHPWTGMGGGKHPSPKPTHHVAAGGGHHPRHHHPRHVAPAPTAARPAPKAVAPQEIIHRVVVDVEVHVVAPAGATATATASVAK